MPMYSYKCESCGYEFEALSKVTDKQKTCPICEKKAVKVFSASSQMIKFEGKGFHVTDYEGRKTR